MEGRQHTYQTSLDWTSNSSGFHRAESPQNAGSDEPGRLGLAPALMM